MHQLDQRPYDDFVARLARHDARFATRIRERIRDDVAPARLLPVQGDVNDLLDRLILAVFVSLRTNEPLDDESTLLVRRTAERWRGQRVPFATASAMVAAASHASVEAAQELARHRELAVLVHVIARGMVVSQEILAAAAAGYEPGLRSTAPSATLGSARGGAAVTLKQTPREVLRLIADGKTNSQIADDLGLSRQAVSYHVGRLMRQFAAVNRTALVARAFDQGLLPRQT